LLNHNALALSICVTVLPELQIWQGKKKRSQRSCRSGNVTVYSDWLDVAFS
jgi:hypothetical protein